MNVLHVAMLALVAASTDTRALDPPPSAAQLRRWMGDECVAAGKHVGIDYPRALDRAIAKDPAGLATLFRFTTSHWYVGAAAESHDGIILGLLQRWGDQDFARVLRVQPRRARKAVVDAIDYSFPYPGWRPTQFPLTYSLAPHEHAPPEA